MAKVLIAWTLTPTGPELRGVFSERGNYQRFLDDLPLGEQLHTHVSEHELDVAFLRLKPPVQFPYPSTVHTNRAAGAA